MSQVFQYMIMMDRKIHLKNLKLQPKCAKYYIRHATIHRSTCTVVHLLKTNTDQISAYEFKCFTRTFL